MKICTRCNLSKDEAEFYKRNSNTLHNECIPCMKQRHLNYYIKNRDKRVAYSSSWQKENKEKRKLVRDRWTKKNPKYMGTYLKKIREIKPYYKIKDNISKYVCTAIKSKNDDKFLKNIGCTVKELKKHLSDRFKLGMTWDNHGRIGWHIDHIIPLSSFDLTDAKQFKNASHFSNLQPLWYFENIQKKDKAA